MMCSKYAKWCAVSVLVCVLLMRHQPWHNQYNKLSLGKLLTAGLLITNQIFINTGKWLNWRQGVTDSDSAHDIRGTVDKYAQPLCGILPFPKLLNLYTFRAIPGFWRRDYFQASFRGPGPALQFFPSTPPTWPLTCVVHKMTCTFALSIWKWLHTTSDKSDVRCSIWW
jgi:hypothetical protein